MIKLNCNIVCLYNIELLNQYLIRACIGVHLFLVLFVNFLHAENRFVKYKHNGYYYDIVQRFTITALLAC